MKMRVFSIPPSCNLLFSTVVIVCSHICAVIYFFYRKKPNFFVKMFLYLSCGNGEILNMTISHILFNKHDIILKDLNFFDYDFLLK